MDSSKKAEFARRFGKRLRLKKGGLVQHYDSGGTILGGPGTATQAPSGVIQNISNALGTNAASANIQQGTNQAQLNNAYTGAQNGLNAQIGLTNTLTPQATTAVGNQNALAEQELAMTNGNGPNPAANQLAEATGANVANQAALMAGARGASANPALAARQAAQQGAKIQQDAAGKAATLNAEQRIAAQNNLANLSGTQIGQTGAATTALNTGQQNEQTILQNANTAANNEAVGMQSNINNNNANTNSGILGGITGALSHVPVIGGLFNEGGEVGAEHPGHKKLEFVHKMTKMGLAHFDGGGTVSGSGSDIAKGIAAAGAASGGGQGNSDLSRYGGHAEGGQIQANPLLQPNNQSAPVNNFGGQYTQNQAPGPLNIENPALKTMDMGIKHKEKDKPQGMGTTSDSTNQNITGENNSLVTTGQADVMEPMAGGDIGNYFNAYKGGNISQGPHVGHVANFLSSGGETKKVPAMVSPNEMYLSPSQVKEVQHGANPLKIAQKFAGTDKVPGKDSRKNDTLPVTLEEGGVVLPIHIVKKMNPEKAALFVLKSLAKKKVRK